ADVNDKGEVTVEGEFAGRLDGFRFTMDKTASVDEAKTLRQAALQALAPEYHLRADRFYNAPDTELDYTEQGGLMWGTNAVGKLVVGPDALKPQVVAFVDEEAGFDIGEKVKRRLQHFIDRKVAALFEPLIALQRDETINGLARGVAFRLAENFGILPRDQIAADVKSLDQDARSALRKHGIRFGQYTLFLPLLLKPAPTRLRLVLWSLAKGLQEFPESPPPGLVTIPSLDGLPDGTYVMSGYFQAGTRAIRIDMLERLADQLRLQDTRAGFEAKPDMLSITGLTLDQFADLMSGLGYQGEKAEREKVKVQPEKPKELTAEEILAEAERKAAAEAGEPTEATQAAPEMEAFYTFTWKPKPRPRPPVERRGERAPHPAATPPVEGDAKPQESRPPRREKTEGKPQGKPQGQRNDRNDKRDGKGDGRPHKGGKPQRDDRKDQGARTFSTGPAKSGKIDPDNPFAALLALKDKS
ncbi:MAG: helicase, partial [Deltaproteobacteria bacterium]